MNRLRKLPLAVSLPAALLLGATAAVARPAPQDPVAAAAAPTIAMVDIDRVLKAYPGAEAQQAAWKVMEADFKSKMEALEAEVRQAMGEREAFTQGTPERLRANLGYELKRLEYEEFHKILAAQAEQRKADVALELYGEIRRGIAAFAKAKGVQLVLRLRADDPNLPKSMRLENNQQREVLYHDPALELTEDVIKFLKTWKPEPEAVAPAANGNGK